MNLDTGSILHDANIYGQIAMIKIFFGCFLLSACLFFGGCSTSYNITNVPSKRVHSFSWLNEELAGEVVDIYLNNGQIKSGKDVKFAHDSVALYDLELRARESLPVSQVSRIRRTNHLLGLFEGTLLGLIGGAVALYVGLESSGFSFSEGENSHESVGADILGITGLLLPPTGITVGAARGHTYEYIILSDSVSSQYDKQNKKPQKSN